VQFYYGAALMDRVDTRSPGNAGLTNAIAALEQAVQLRPGFTDAERVLGYGYLAADQPAKARDALRRALQQDPGDQNTTLMLAEALLRLGQFSDARTLLGPIVGRSTDTSVKERARDLLGRSATIQQQLQLRAEVASDAPTAPTAPAATAPAQQATPPANPPRPNFQPVFRKVESGETRSYGVFTDIECARGQVVLHVRVPGRTLLLRAERFDAIDFISYRSSTPGTISCGPRRPAEDIYVTWRADETTITSGVSQGIAVAVELLPDGFLPSR